MGCKYAKYNTHHVYYQAWSLFILLVQTTFSHHTYLKQTTSVHLKIIAK